MKIFLDKVYSKMSNYNYKNKIKLFENKLQEYNGFPKIIIWYYRAIGITFGGLVFNEKNEIVSNKWLRHLGTVIAVLCVIVLILIIYFFMNDQDHLIIYEKGFHLTYYLTGSLVAMDVIQIVVNHLFNNSNAIPIFKTINEYGLGKIARFITWSFPNHFFRTQTKIFVTFLILWRNGRQIWGTDLHIQC